MHDSSDKLILYVDNDELYRKKAEKALSKAGYQAVFCTTGAEALKIIRMIRDSPLPEEKDRFIRSIVVEKEGVWPDGSRVEMPAGHHHCSECRLLVDAPKKPGSFKCPSCKKPQTYDPDTKYLLRAEKRNGGDGGGKDKSKGGKKEKREDEFALE